jgi:hypothetical protein
MTMKLVILSLGIAARSTETNAFPVATANVGWVSSEPEFQHRGIDVDLTFSDEDRTFQQEVRDWLKTAWPQEMRDKAGRSALGKLSKDDLVALAEAPGREGLGGAQLAGRIRRRRLHADPEVHLRSGDGRAWARPAWCRSA